MLGGQVGSVRCAPETAEQLQPAGWRSAYSSVRAGSPLVHEPKCQLSGNFCYVAPVRLASTISRKRRKGLRGLLAGTSALAFQHLRALRGSYPVAHRRRQGKPNRL